eukprot:m.2751 g.2751  ORF g.2751 m.2751 type:complete len:206 (-) comp2019_c0_seq1:319-936(-)
MAAKNQNFIDIDNVLNTLHTAGGKRTAPSSSVINRRSSAFTPADSFAEYGDDYVDIVEEQPARSQDQPCSTWLADSGASAHIITDARLLTNYMAVQRFVTVANSQATQVVGMGNVILSVADTNGTDGTLTLREVLHVSDITQNLLALLSCAQGWDHGAYQQPKQLHRLRLLGCTSSTCPQRTSLWRGGRRYSSSRGRTRAPWTSQ